MSKPPLKDGHVSVPKKESLWFHTTLAIWLRVLRRPEFWDGLKYAVSVDLPMHIGNDAWVFFEETDVFWAILRIHAGPTWGTEWGTVGCRAGKRSTMSFDLFRALGKMQWITAFLWTAIEWLASGRISGLVCAVGRILAVSFWLFFIMDGNLSSEIKFRVFSGQRSN